MSRILVATDAWEPQVNGVVRTLQSLAGAVEAYDSQISFLTAEGFWTFGLPTYSAIRLALPSTREIAARIDAARPDAIHIATEGPIGHLVRRYCVARRLSFTTSFHTRLPDYVAARVPIPRRWTWNWLRWFHRPAARVMVSTPALATELKRRRFDRVSLWPRGVDADLFRPRPGCELDLPRPVFLFVGRLSVEKNLPEFLRLDLPGSKVVVGDGPAYASLKAAFPGAHFLGEKRGEELAHIYAAADVFVFPSRSDTFGLVLLEALASGVPIAALPTQSSRNVLAGAPVGVIDNDLRGAALRALSISRNACRDFALRHGWSNSAQAFLGNLVSVRTE
jgi:glycosyltransferase involved in cell wall biosynthesis